MKRKVLAIIIGSLIFLALVLLGLKPIVLRTLKPSLPEEKKAEVFSQEVEPLLAENDIILGINPLYSGQGITWQDNSLTVSEDGTYNITGNLPLGQIIITAPKQVTLNLNNVSIFNETKAVLDIETNGRVILKVNGENNFTSDSLLAIDSKSDLLITGEGKITIASNGDGIKATNVVIEANKTYIMAKNSVFAKDTTYQITKDEFIALGTSNLGKIASSPKQNVLIFNLPDKLTNDDNLSLQSIDTAITMNFKGLNDANYIILSRADLANTDYILTKNSEKMTIGEKDTFNVGDGLNIFN